MTSFVKFMILFLRVYQIGMETEVKTELIFLIGKKRPDLIIYNTERLRPIPKKDCPS